MSGVESVPAPWQGVALVCRKCSKRLKGGFGAKGKETLSRVLRDSLKASGHRRAVRVVEVGCLGFCPKRAVTIAGLPGRVLLVPAGAEIGQVIAAVLPSVAEIG